MSCCVPGCINVLREWTSEFPCDEELLARWKAAIQVGTGQFLPVESDPKGAPVCNMHFRVKSTDALEMIKYREPSLFFRDNVLLEVSWCRLCSRYEVIDNMLDMEDCLQQGDVLQWMAKKYSGSTQLGKEDVFFCDTCIARVSKTDAFEQEICDAARKHDHLLGKMAMEGFTMTSVSSIRIENMEKKDSQSISKDILEKKVTTIETFRGIVVKKEPQMEELSESDSSENLANSVGSAKDIVVKQLPSQSQKVEMAEAYTIEYLKDPVETPMDAIVKEEPQLVEVDDPSSKTGWYKCTFCDKSYRMQHELVLHIKTIHPTAASIRKNQNQWICHTQTGGQKRVRRTNGHRQFASRMGGESRKETVCLLCKKLFQHSRDIVTHFEELHTDTDLRYYPCPLCNEVFFSASSIRTHVYIHNDVYNCDRCGKNLRSSDALVNHRHTFHGEPLSENRYVVCPACNQKFKRYNFNKHGRTCEGKVKEFSCNRCDKLFTVRHDLREHMKLHVAEEPFTCAGCGKNYSSPHSLNSHKYVCKSRIEENPSICSTCGKRFTSPQLLTSHTYVCKGKVEGKSLICSGCGKGYGNRASLAAHKYVCKGITVEKPLVCSGCGKRYRNRGSLVSHEKECSYVVKDEKACKAQDDSVAGRLSRRRKGNESDVDDLVKMEPRLEPSVGPLESVEKMVEEETDEPQIVVKMEPNEPLIEAEEGNSQLERSEHNNDETHANKNFTSGESFTSKGEREILVWMPR